MSEAYYLVPTQFFKNLSMAESLFEVPKFRKGLNITPDWLWAPKSFPIDIDTGEDWTEEDMLVWKYIYSEFESHLQSVCDFSGYDEKDLRHIWFHLQEDVWDPDDPSALQNDDIHKDIFENMYKVINMQVYMGDTRTQEDEVLGTMFWEYVGDNPDKDLGSEFGEYVISHNPSVFELIGHAPYKKNTAIMYNPGYNGIWHSAPTHEVLNENNVAKITRKSVIARYCFNGQIQ
tara:strand:- start:16769 stop:17464 length:696 start_codon:yes stop_codon:yes gene_type:complete